MAQRYDQLGTQPPIAVSPDYMTNVPNPNTFATQRIIYPTAGIKAAWARGTHDAMTYNFSQNHNGGKGLLF